MSVFDVLFYRLKALCANHPRPVVGFDAFSEIYRDEIAEELGDTSITLTKRSTFSHVSIRPRQGP